MKFNSLLTQAMTYLVTLGAGFGIAFALFSKHPEYVADCEDFDCYEYLDTVQQEEVVYETHRVELEGDSLKPDTSYIKENKVINRKPNNISIDSTSLDSIKTYIHNYNDGIIRIKVTSEIDGVFVDQTLDYKLSWLVFDRDTNIVKLINIQPKVIQKDYIKGGLEIGGNGNYFQYSPLLEYEFYDRKSIGLRYEINGPMGNSIHARFVVPLFAIPRKN